MPSVLKYGLCPGSPRTSVQGVQFQESLEAEQARYIHRSVPTAALGGLVVVVLVVLIFRSVVPRPVLYVWLGAFVLLTAARAPGWLRFRTVLFGAETSRRWLRQATIASFASGVLWGLGSLFLFPQ